MNEVSTEITLILCYGTDGSNFSCLRCDSVSSCRNRLKIRSNILPPASWWKLNNIKINRKVIRKLGQSGPRARRCTKMIGPGSAPRPHGVTKQMTSTRIPSSLNRAAARGDRSYSDFCDNVFMLAACGQHGGTGQCCQCFPSLFQNGITSLILMYLQSPVLSEFCCHVNWLIVSYIT
jgi:hypothetical protein